MAISKVSASNLVGGQRNRLNVPSAYGRTGGRTRPDAADRAKSAVSEINGFRLGGEMNSWAEPTIVDTLWPTLPKVETGDLKLP